MKNKSKLLLISILSMVIVGCQSTPTEVPSNANPSLDVSSEEVSSLSPTTEDISSQEPASEEVSSDDTVYTTFVELEDVNIEVGERYSLKSTLSPYKGISVTSKDIKIASYGTSNGVILGKKVGTTHLVLNYQDQNA